MLGSIIRYSPKMVRSVSARRQSARPYEIRTRSVHTQDVMLGLSNRRNYDLAMKYALSVGPSMLIPAAEQGLETIWNVHPGIVTKNDNILRMFGLYTNTSAQYLDFVSNVSGNVWRKNGLFVISLTADDKPDGLWKPDSLIRFLQNPDAGDLSSLKTRDLLFSYLKRREKQISQKDLQEIAKIWDVGDEKRGQAPGSGFLKMLEETKELGLSYTDAEFGYLLTKLTDDQLRNLCVLHPDGRVLNSLQFKAAFKKLLDGSEKSWPELIGPDSVSSIHSNKIKQVFEAFPVFDIIGQRVGDAVRANLDMLYLKIATYVENLTSEKKGLFVTLQFPLVHGNAPHFTNILLSRKGKDIVFEEVLIAETDPLSVMRSEPSEKLLNSVLYCASPSANMCIVEDVDVFRIRAAKKTPQQTSDDPRYVEALMHAMYETAYHDSVKLRHINGRQLNFSSPVEDWDKRREVMDSAGFLQTSITVNPKSPGVSFVSASIIFPGGQIPENFVPYVYDKSVASNYLWTLSTEMDFHKLEEPEHGISRLPAGVALPTYYQQHIGMMSPYNSDYKGGRMMAEDLGRVIADKKSVPGDDC